MIRVLLVAPYASVRAGLLALLTDAPDCVIVGQVSGSGDLERLLPDLRPDVILLDTQPGEIRPVLELMAGGEAGLVLLGEGRDDGLPLLQSTLTGWGWLQKNAETAELVAAMHAVTAGLVVLDPALVPILGREGDRLREATPFDEALTSREHEVLQLIAQGLANKQIASRLSISLHTVKFHVTSILAKLGAASRTEAVTLGARRGLVLL